MTRHKKRSSPSKLYRSAAHGLVWASAGFVTALVLTYQGGDALGDAYLSDGAHFIEHRAVESKTVALNRRIARVRRAQTEEAVRSASDEPIFAHSEDEAKEKILAKLLEEAGRVAPVSVDDLSCSDELLPQERAELDAELKRIEPAKYELAPAWNTERAEATKEQVVRNVLGMKRYEEWHSECQQSQESLRKQMWDRDVATSVTIIAAHLGLDDELQRKMSELVREQYRLREAIAPSPSVQFDGNGEPSLTTSPLEIDAEATMQIEAKRVALESEYVARFKELLGPERWMAYKERFIESSRYGWSQLDYEAHSTLFGSDPGIFSEEPGSTPSASEAN